MDARDRILVIVDGSLCSVVGLALAQERAEPVAWVPAVGTDVGDAPVGTHHLSAVRAQLDRLGVERIVFPPEEAQAPSELGDGALGANTSVSLALVRAAHDALHLGCRSVLWPVCGNGNIESTFRATELAATVSRLVGLDQPGALRDIELAIRTPLADMGRDQVAALAYDLDAPVECCWSMRTREEQVQSEDLRALRASWQNAIVLAAKMRGWEASVQLPGDANDTPARAYL